jgi:hypothetical protein
MSKLILSLDSKSIFQSVETDVNFQIGENGHVEYGWSNHIREKIVQFSFQCLRTDDKGIKILEDKFKEILIEITESKDTISENERKDMIVTLYKIIAYTRDIIIGKGEYKLSYMMIKTWYDYFRYSNFTGDGADYALYSFVNPPINQESEEHTYGSWKDIKYFCCYCIENGWDITHPLISFAITMINSQLKKDYEAYLNNEKNISLAAKWIPREKSKKFGMLYTRLSQNYFLHYFSSVNKLESNIKAHLKAKMNYRKILSTLNKYLDTVQIKQCQNKWASIDHSKTTSITMNKQKNAFLNINKNGSHRTDKEDRIECANNMKKFIIQSLKDKKEIKGKRIGLNHFTKEALELINSNSNDEIFKLKCDLLNSQWRDNSSQNVILRKMIPMVDTSLSMEGDPKNVAIALGCRVAEKSLIGKRVMTFSAYPTWVNLDDCNNFINMVSKISKANWGCNTNFYAALNMILEVIIENKMKPEEVEDMILVIFSDMQMDCAEGSKNSYKTLYKTIEEKYEFAGIRLHGKAFKPPHILFWNLKSTTGFPTLYNEKNVSMMSGFNSSLLNDFCECGINGLQKATPYSQLMNSLNNERYKRMEEYMMNLLSNYTDRKEK